MNIPKIANILTLAMIFIPCFTCSGIIQKISSTTSESPNFELYTIKFNESVTVDFKTSYSNTKVLLSPVVFNIEHRINYTLLDDMNYNLYLQNKTYTPILRGINVKHNTNQTIILKFVEDYHLIIENKIPYQISIEAGVMIIYYDDAFFNPDTIPVYFGIIFLLVIISGSGYIFWRKHN
ncbi:MAG: hypothetical protein ACTSP4_00205 [Candidatus Hodarchaeales archaeon]